MFAVRLANPKHIIFWIDSGHVFWDQDIWDTGPLALLDPPTAAALADFRHGMLGAARDNARLFGRRGAQYPWEAMPGEEGADETPPAANTAWAEQHITPDVAIGVYEAALASADQTFVAEKAWPVLSGIAEWLEHRGEFTERGFEWKRVMGPDESTPIIDNSAYFNLVAAMAIDSAIATARRIDKPVPSSWLKIRDSVFLDIGPAPGYESFGDVLQPFDGADPRGRGASSDTGLRCELHQPARIADFLKKRFCVSLVCWQGRWARFSSCGRTGSQTGCRA